MDLLFIVLMVFVVAIVVMAGFVIRCHRPPAGFVLAVPGAANGGDRQ